MHNVLWEISNILIEQDSLWMCQGEVAGMEDSCLGPERDVLGYTEWGCAEGTYIWLCCGRWSLAASPHLCVPLTLSTSNYSIEIKPQGDVIGNEMQNHKLDPAETEKTSNKTQPFLIFGRLFCECAPDVLGWSVSSHRLCSMFWIRMVFYQTRSGQVRRTWAIRPFLFLVHSHCLEQFDLVRAQWMYDMW